MYLSETKIKTRNNISGIIYQLKCDWCNKIFYRKHHDQKGNVKIRKHFCNHSCANSNKNWNGGKYKSSDGYIYVYTTKNKRGILEHRLIMEKFLNRKLLSGEIIHHINGIRDDNRIENLQLRTFKNHEPGHENFYIQTINYLKNKIVELENKNTLPIKINIWKNKQYYKIN